MIDEYGISIDIPLDNAAANDAYDFCVARLREAQNEALELQALAVFDPEKYRALMKQREVDRWRSLSWRQQAEETVTHYRERIALLIAPWLDPSDYE